MGIVRPRKLLFIAIDGVAPRAKMNQQRSRRFRSVQEAEESNRIESDFRQELKNVGEFIPEKRPSSWDSNIITPGTSFMKTLSEHMRYYIHDRITNHKGWDKIKVILSDSSVPGEGEHKIIEYIRIQRQQKNYDPNTQYIFFHFLLLFFLIFLYFLLLVSFFHSFHFFLFFFFFSFLYYFLFNFSFVLFNFILFLVM